MEHNLIELLFLRILNSDLGTFSYLVSATETAVDAKNRMETHSMVMTSKQSIILLIVCDALFPKFGWCAIHMKLLFQEYFNISRNKTNIIPTPLYLSVNLFTED